MAMKPKEAGKKLSKESMEKIQKAERELDREINLHYNGADKIEIEIKVETQGSFLTLNEVLELERKYKEAGWEKLTYGNEFTSSQGNPYRYTITLYA